MNEFELVKRAIDEWDPVGLLSLGCPEDEYDPEVRDIADQLPSMNSVEELAEMIHAVFVKWFGDGAGNYTVQDCFIPAMKIWNRYCIVH